MKKLTKFFVLTILICVGDLFGQDVKSVVPDSGAQGQTFPITVNGRGTEWTLSPYFEVYFDSIGVATYGVVIVNDSTLTGNIVLDGRASTGWHKVTVADQFFNFFTKDTAFFVRLSKPVAPVQLSPPNNSQNVNQNTYFLWDSNGYATSFRIQVASDTNIGSVVFDTVVANTPFTIRLGVLTLGQKYFWRVNASNALGTSQWSSVFSFRVRTTGINVISSEIPATHKLIDNYPNPFNPVTKIRFNIGKLNLNEKVILEVFDITGRRMGLLINEKLQPGSYEVNWDATSLPSGMYLYRLTVGSYSETKRMAVIK
jgi:hypothetical protein